MPPKQLQNARVSEQVISSNVRAIHVAVVDGSGNQVTAFGTGGSVSGILSKTLAITSTHSTAVYELVSSVASQSQKVFAYFVGSTHTLPSTLVFMSSGGVDLWAVNFGSGSSGITGANLAVTPPASIFNTVAGDALNVRVEGGSSAASTVVARVSISWRSEA